MTRTFVILCTGRTGSQHLVSLLDSHPEVRCYGELFTPHENPCSACFVNSPHEDAREYLGELAAGTGTSAMGLKLPMDSIRAHPVALDLLHDRELRIIRLVRRNRLAQLVSRRLAAKTGAWHSVEGPGTYGEARVRIRPAECLAAIESIELQDRLLDELARHNPVAWISYEELAAGEGIDDVQRFLDLEPRPLSSFYERLRRRPLPEVVANWEELAAELRATRFERYLELAA